MIIRMYDAEDIKRLRDEAGMTLAAFAKEMQVDESTACNWEKGRQHPRFDTLKKLNKFAEKIRAGKSRNGRLAGAGS